MNDENCLEEGKEVEFDRKKYFKYVKPLGSGGTGDAHLFEDETTDMLFAFKKYNPSEGNNKKECYDRFVEEIKILFQLSHPNIVRIYNHYLYPEALVGYIQMEYIDGCSINEFDPFLFNKNWEDIFKEVILTFEYLESRNILHRDIRAQNIMIDSNEDVKIIDFGFSKKLTGNKEDKNSILLNWPVSEHPEEVTNQLDYNHQTEIYYLGKLFTCLTTNTNFDFKKITEKMSEVELKDRYTSFSQIINDFSKRKKDLIRFSKENKQIYLRFADSLIEVINHFKDEFRPRYNIEEILDELSKILEQHSMEDKIQTNTALIGCFTYSSFQYKNRSIVDVEIVQSFYGLLLSLDNNKIKNVLSNLYNRFSRLVKEDDGVPF